jgi:hypothetical protein
MADESWESWGKHVIRELERLNANMEKIEQRILKSESMKVDIATLQVKSAVWGAAAGMIPVALVILIKYFT